MAYFIDGSIDDGNYISIIDQDYNLIVNNGGSYGIVDVSSGNIPSNYASLRVVISATETTTTPAEFYLMDGSSYVYIQNNILKTSTTRPNPMKAKQTKYQPWEKPFAFFPGAVYDVYDVDGNLAGMPNVPLLFYFIPIFWYASPCKVPASTQLGLQYHVEWMASGDRPTIGFTKQNECKKGFDYPPCSMGSNCGVSCKGPCPNPSQSCNLLHSQFVCSAGVNSWWSSRVFFILVGLIAIILIVATFFVIFQHPDVNEWIRTSQGEDDEGSPTDESP